MHRLVYLLLVLGSVVTILSIVPLGTKNYTERMNKVHKDSFQTLEIYDTFSHEWWDEEGFATMLHRMNPIRIQYYTEKIMDYIKKNGKKAINIVDLGCGGGLLTEQLARNLATILIEDESPSVSILGIDQSRSSIEFATKHLKENPILNDRVTLSYSVGHLKEYLKKKVDFMIMSDVLEHIDDVPLGSVLQNMTNTLKSSSGCFLYDTPEKNLASYFSVIRLSEDVFGTVPKGTHDFSLFVASPHLKSYFKDQGATFNEQVGVSPNIVWNNLYLMLSKKKKWSVPPLIDFKRSNYFWIQYMGIHCF